jgi:hypothetical protein
MEPLSAMVSYSWDDAVAAELIHEELALRGFDVFHDRCSFPLGSRIGQNMADGVHRCDAFVAYLTPSSLYIGEPDGNPRPAIDEELVPMIKRWRTTSAAAANGGSAAPVIVPLVHGLGDPRAEAPKAVFDATGEDISSFWTPVLLNQTTGGITQPEAAEVAGCLVRSVLVPGRRPPQDAPLDLVVTTRGEGQMPGFVTVDATCRLGGETSRPGAEEDWNRFLLGIRDLQASLARWTRERRLHVLARAHLTGCLATGRVFNQASGWQLAVAGRFGDTVLPHDSQPDSRVDTVVDKTGGKGAMSIEIDMIGGNVVDLATTALRSASDPPCARVQFHRTGTGDLLPLEVGAAAAVVASNVREQVGRHRPGLARVFCASPAEFAVLLGTRLTSLHTDLQLYERDGGRYVPSLLIPAEVP